MNIIDKYVKKFNYIASKHLKIIEKKSSVRNVLDKWIKGELLGIVKKDGKIRELKPEKDEFFKKLDLFQEDELRTQEIILKKMFKIFDEFPKYSTYVECR